MWSQVPAVQVMVWRMFMHLSAEGWSQDLMNMLYLDDKTLAWAQAVDDGENDSSCIRHIDNNGAVLSVGDTVTLINILM